MKKSSAPQNVLIIDSDYDEASGFIKGVQEITQEKWKVALYENNTIYCHCFFLQIISFEKEI